MCRLADALPIGGASAPKFPPVGFDRQKVALLTARTGLIYGSHETSSAERVAVSVYHLVRPLTNGTISLPTRYGLASAPFVIQHPYHLAWDGLRPVYGGVVFPSCQNCSIKRAH
jgi:hypothetical protein